MKYIIVLAFLAGFSLDASCSTMIPGSYRSCAFREIVDMCNSATNKTWLADQIQAGGFGNKPVDCIIYTIQAGYSTFACPGSCSSFAQTFCSRNKTACEGPYFYFSQYPVFAVVSPVPSPSPTSLGTPVASLGKGPIVLATMLALYLLRGLVPRFRRPD